MHTETLAQNSVPSITSLRLPIEKLKALSFNDISTSLKSLGKRIQSLRIPFLDGETPSIEDFSIAKNLLIDFLQKSALQSIETLKNPSIIIDTYFTKENKNIRIALCILLTLVFSGGLFEEKKSHDHQSHLFEGQSDQLQYLLKNAPEINEHTTVSFIAAEFGNSGVMHFGIRFGSENKYYYFGSNDYAKYKNIAPGYVDFFVLGKPGIMKSSNIHTGKKITTLYSASGKNYAKSVWNSIIAAEKGDQYYQFYLSNCFTQSIGHMNPLTQGRISYNPFENLREGITKFSKAIFSGEYEINK